MAGEKGSTGVWVGWNLSPAAYLKDFSSQISESLCECRLSLEG